MSLRLLRQRAHPWPASSVPRSHGANASLTAEPESARMVGARVGDLKFNEKDAEGCNLETMMKLLRSAALLKQIGG